MTVASWADGRQTVRPVPARTRCPRVVPAADWAAVAAGVEQRHRALNAFLADAYRAAGRRRGDADRAPEVVRAGRAAGVGGRAQPRPRPDAVGQAWPGQPRAALAAADVLRTADGGVAGRRRPPAGARRPRLRPRQPRQRCAPPCPGCSPARAPADPRGRRAAAARRALAAAAPPACAGTPRIAVLSAGRERQRLVRARPAGRRAGRAAGPRGRPLAADGRRGRGRRRRRAAPGRRALPPLRRRHARGLPDADRAAAGRAAHRGRAVGPARPGQRAGQRARRRRRHLRLGAGDDPLLPGRGAAARARCRPGCWPTTSSGRRCATGCTSWSSSRSPGTAAGARSSARPARPPSWPRCRRRSPPRPTASSRRSRWRPRTVPTLVDGGLQPRHVDLRVFSVSRAGGTARRCRRR